MEIQSTKIYRKSATIVKMTEYDAIITWFFRLPAFILIHLLETKALISLLFQIDDTCKSRGILVQSQVNSPSTAPIMISFLFLLEDLEGLFGPAVEGEVAGRIQTVN